MIRHQPKANFASRKSQICFFNSILQKRKLAIILIYQKEKENHYLNTESKEKYFSIDYLNN